MNRISHYFCAMTPPGHLDVDMPRLYRPAPPNRPAPRCECGASMYVFDDADFGPSLVCPDCTTFEPVE